MGADRPGEPADISAVVIWHYHAEGRVYHSVVVQVSDDPEFIKDVKTVFNNDYANALGFGAGKNLEYIDDYRGKAIAVKDAKGGPVRGRYVRLHSNGNTSNDQNHYIEVEVYGKPANDASRWTARAAKRTPPVSCFGRRDAGHPGRRGRAASAAVGPAADARRRGQPGGQERRCSTRQASTNTTPRTITAPASIG